MALYNIPDLTTLSVLGKTNEVGYYKVYVVWNWL